MTSSVPCEHCLAEAIEKHNHDRKRTGSGITAVLSGDHSWNHERRCYAVVSKEITDQPFHHAQQDVNARED